MFSPQHGTTQASELVNLQSFFTANILPELEIKNGECWGYLFIFGTVFFIGESLFTVIFCLLLTYILNSFGEILFENPQNLQRLYEAIFAKS